MGIQLCDPAIVPDTFAFDIFDVEDLGEGNYRLIFYSRQRSTYDGVGYDYPVAARIVVTSSTSLKLAQKIMIKTGVQCCGGSRLRSMAH